MSHTLFKSKSSQPRSRELVRPKPKEIEPKETSKIIGELRRMPDTSISSRITLSSAK